MRALLFGIPSEVCSETAQQSGALRPAACITPSFSSFFQTVMLP